MTAADQDVVRALIVRDDSANEQIEGVTLRALQVNRDPRGTLTELLRSDWADVFGPEMPFAQAYLSTTGTGIARDEDRWHVHKHQTDRFYCVAGQIVVAIADARAGSPTHGRIMLVELTADRDAPASLMVTIPPGTLHGFVVTSTQPASLINFPNRLYDPSDEGRLPFTEAGITFPDGTPFSYDPVRDLYR